MKKQTKKLISIAIIICVIVFSIYYFYDTSSSTYTGLYSGSLHATVIGVTETGEEVELPSKMLAFVSGTARITALKLNLTWETYDIQEGMNASTFQINVNGSVFTACSVTSLNKSWSLNQTSLNYLSSPTLNSSNVWSFNLKSSPLDLQTEANKNSKYQTDFTINFTLPWTASMYDSIDQTVETQSGTITTQVLVYYTSGFKINVR